MTAPNPDRRIGEDAVDAVRSIPIQCTDTTCAYLTDKDARRVISAFLSSSPKGDGWISTEDQLPVAKPYSARVLICYHYRHDKGVPPRQIITMAWRMDDGWRFDKGGTDTLEEQGFIATHWMPLPAFPHATSPNRPTGATP